MYNNQMFSAKTLEEAFTPYSNEKPGIKNYGYGWRMNNYPNGKKLFSTEDGGMETILCL